MLTHGFLRLRDAECGRTLKITSAILESAVIERILGAGARGLSAGCLTTARRSGQRGLPALGMGR